jgi:hypothetical protein
LPVFEDFGKVQSTCFVLLPGMWKRDLIKDLLRHVSKQLLFCTWIGFLPRFVMSGISSI